MACEKLIRDKIPALAAAVGGSPMTVRRCADDAEYWSFLARKLREEVEEVIGNPSPEEIGDVLEVLEAIGAFRGLNGSEVILAKCEKRISRGGFHGRLVMVIGGRDG